MSSKIGQIGIIRDFGPELPAPQLKFKVSEWFVASNQREWWCPDTFEEALQIAIQHYPAIIFITDEQGICSGSIEVGEKQFKEWGDNVEVEWKKCK